MNKNNAASRRTVYMIGFALLTLLCWCPLGYGGYGEVDRIFSMPSWAAVLLLLGLVLVILEGRFLFYSNLTLTDEKLSKIVSELREIRLDEDKPAGEV